MLRSTAAQQHVAAEAAKRTSYRSPITVRGSAERESWAASHTKSVELIVAKHEEEIRG